MKNLLKLMFFLMILPFSAKSMHKHESSSIVPGRTQVGLSDQEVKRDDEFRSNPKIKSADNKKLKTTISSKVDQINDFRRTRLNDHLANDLSSIVLDYDNIDKAYSNDYYVSDVIDAEPGDSSIARIVEIMPLNDGNFYTVSDKNKEKVWKLKNGKISCIHVIENYCKNITKLQSGSIACMEGSEVKIIDQKGSYYLSYDGKIYLNRVIRRFLELENGLLVSSTYMNNLIIWKYNGEKYCFYQELYGYDFNYEPINSIALKDSSFVVSTWSNDMKVFKLNKNNQYECFQVIPKSSDLHNIIYPSIFKDCFFSSETIMVIKVWKLQDNGQYDCINIINIDYIVTDIIQLSDGSLAVYSNDSTIFIYDLKNGTFKTLNLNKLENFNETIESGRIIQLIDGSIVTCYFGCNRITVLQSELSKVAIPKG